MTFRDRSRGVAQHESGSDKQSFAVGGQDGFETGSDGAVQGDQRGFVRRSCCDQLFEHRVVFVVLDDRLLAREVPEEGHV